MAGVIGPTTADILGRVERSLAALQEVQLALPGSPAPAHAEAVADIRSQLATLVGPGFVAATGAAHLDDLTRYLTAIGRRLGRLSQAPAADRERMARVHAVQGAYDQLLEAISPTRAAAADVVDIARMIQEFRVSLWAQQLGTPRRSASSGSTGRSTRCRGRDGSRAKSRARRADRPGALRRWRQGASDWSVPWSGC